MMKRLFLVSITLILTAISSAQAKTPLGKFGDWEAFTDREDGKRLCYMGSIPTKQRGNYKRRGVTYMMVTHRPAEKSKNVVSVKAGYTFKTGSEPEVIIGKTVMKMFVGEDYAYTNNSRDDDQLVKTMIRGAIMTVKGTSSRGTLTTDTYSLKGFTAAYKAISAACKI
jgi:invasion protein IalB